MIDNYIDLFKTNHIIIRNIIDELVIDIRLCDQCNLSNISYQTRCIKLNPEEVILICDVCFNKKEKILNKLFDYIKNYTQINSIDLDLYYYSNLSLKKEWKYNNKYPFPWIKNQIIYFPLENNNNTIWIDFRSFCILNDLNIFNSNQ